MKVTRYQLRKIILEEAMRTRPIELYSDEELMQEGLLSWLKDLWKGLKAEFNKRASSSRSKATAGISKVSADGVQKAAKKYGVEGIKSIDDLDMKDKTHQKIYWTAIVPVIQKFIAEDMKTLKILVGVKDWTPKSDSKEDVAAWEEAEGDKNSEFWGMQGRMLGTLGWFGEKGISIAEEASKAGGSDATYTSHGAAVKWMIDATKVLEGLWDQAATMDVAGAAEASSGYAGVQTGLMDLGKAIASSAKEQQAEWVNIRRFVSATILSEDLER